MAEATKVGPAELARGGYKRVQETVNKLVKEKTANILNTSLSDEWKDWLVSGSSKEAGEGNLSPGPSDWVTVTPTNPTTTLSDSNFLLSFRARFSFPLVKKGNPMC